MYTSTHIFINEMYTKFCSYNNSWRNQKTFMKTTDILTVTIQVILSECSEKQYFGVFILTLLGTTAGKGWAAFFIYLAVLGKLSGQLPPPKFNSCNSPWWYHQENYIHLHLFGRRINHSGKCWKAKAQGLILEAHVILSPSKN